jgi:hypothetical protein
MVWRAVIEAAPTERMSRGFEQAKRRDDQYVKLDSRPIRVSAVAAATPAPDFVGRSMSNQMSAL